MLRPPIVAFCLLLCTAAACDETSGTSSVSGPGGTSPATLNLTGAFSTATLTDSSGVTSMRWLLAHSGNQITGTLTLAATGGRTGGGSVTGTMNGTTLTFTARVPEGGFAPPLFANCSSTISGTAPNVTNDRIVTTYTGTNSCDPPGTTINGSMDLRRE